MRLSYLFLFLAIFYCSHTYSQTKTEDDIKKQAILYFENEDYNLAYKLYSQLVSIYPKDADYNYRLGVCMLYAEPDKKKPYSYLLLATKNTTDAPKEAKFYLAKTYHINYRFDEAIKLYIEYKKIASDASIKKLQVDREIQACKNGKLLLSNLTDLVVITKKQLNESDYFKGYDVNEIGGKLLVKPDEYKSSYDKKKKDKSVVYLPKSGDRLYYSSYGEGGSNGRDIYFVNKLPNGRWSKAQILPSIINTEYDEDYPFLHPNGKTLYFSSKGHNSMGGYDIFKTTYNPETQTWNTPINLEFPINSPDDDILFVTDSLEKTAFFSTGRYSPYGKLDVLKINTERRPMNFAVIKGTVVKEESAQSLKSKITVKNMANGETVGTFQAQENGDYNMELPNGGKFIFTVETPGIQTQSEGIQVPVAYTLKPYKQVISYEKKILKIINYFDGTYADDSYSMMIDQIEKKAKLEVNESDPYTNSLLKDPSKNQIENTKTNSANQNEDSTNNISVKNNDEAVKTNTNKNVSNDQLLTIAKEDAKVAQSEAVRLKKEAEDAFGLATQKTAEAVALQKDADAAIANANSITDFSNKNEELSKANQLKEEAKIASAVANTATNLAKKLEVDADLEQKDADLTNQYIGQLEAITKNKNNKEALTKLESIQKQLDDLSKEKNQSDELFNSLKAESELKQKELLSSENKSYLIANEINNLKNESSDLEKDFNNETDKTVKENITAQIRELTGEIELKNKELTTNNQKIQSLKNEVEGVNQELQIAAKILNEKPDNITNNSKIYDDTSETLTNSNNNAPDTYKSITDKYTEKLNTDKIDKTNNEDLTKQNEILKTFNSEVNNLITIDKNKLSSTKDIKEKKILSDELKSLEKLKIENDKTIASNNTTIKELVNAESVAKNEEPVSKNNTDEVDRSNTNTIATKTTNGSDISNNTITNNAATIKPISTLIENDNTALLNELSNLKNGLNKNSNVASTIFGYNNYAEPTSVALKQTANEKFDQSKQNESKLELLIAKTESDLKMGSSNSVASVLNDAELLSNKALEQRKQSASATGAEKEGLQKEALKNENLATDKKLEAATLQQNKNKTSFDTNSNNLAELKKLTGQKTSNDISQANMLIDEAALNFKQAQKMRVEAETYPSGSAKLGGLSNAEEKENEALLKQQKSLDILSKANPSFIPILPNNGLTPANSISTVNAEVNKTAQLQGGAYVALSNANQNELKLQNEKLIKNPKFTVGTNKVAQDFKLKSDKFNTEAKVFISKSASATTTTEKADLLLKANEKEIESIKNLTAANNALNNESILAIENKTSPISTNETDKQVVNNSKETGNNSIPKTVSPKSENTSVPDNNSTSNNTADASINQNNKNQNTEVITNTTSKNNATSNDNLADKLNQPQNNTNNISNDNTADEAAKLKEGLNNNTAKELTNFNAYTNNEAIELKVKATEKINTAFEQDKIIIKSLDEVNRLAKSNTNEGVLNQQNITSIINEADNLNAQALVYRKSADTKTGNEKVKDLNAAKTAEAEALSKKKDAAAKQKFFNESTYNANKQSLTDLANLAKGKNIAELNSAELKNNEAALYFKQANSIRNEASLYPTDAAKLGGYSNAEEKENLAIEKQQQLLDTYKKYFANYTPAKVEIKNENTEVVLKLNDTKTSINNNNQTYIDGLLQITQANVKEFKTRLLNIPEVLNTNQESVKTKAKTSYKKQNELLEQANQVSDNTNKKNILIEASKFGQEAINFLNEIKGIDVTNKANLTSNNPIENNAKTNTTVSNTNADLTKTNLGTDKLNNSVNNTNLTPTSPTPPTNQNTVNNNTVKIKVEGVEVKTSNAYTAGKPIPIDEKMQDGLVFKVQIGAFKTQLPNGTFKGLSPVIAQTTPSGYIRYMAGNFEQYTSANAVKNDLKNLGYSDAFVVAYYNGKRINLNEATDKAKGAGQSIEMAPNTTAGLTSNNNMPRNIVTATNNNIVNNSDSQNAEISGELEKLNGLLYTVQIGVYSKQVTQLQLSNLKPIYTELLPNGLYRYTAGIYNNKEFIIQDKLKVVELGVKDAFVSAYYNSKRIAFADGQKLQVENQNLKMEIEKPIIFPNVSATAPITIAQTNVPNIPTPQNTVPNPTSLNAFSNGITSGPLPTADNGVKVDEAGISYKVQIGAYKNQVPNDMAFKFLNIKTWPIQNSIINGLYIYTIGNFNGILFVKKLKEEAILLGITDAYITVYRDGKKLYGAEATEYLNK